MQLSKEGRRVPRGRPRKYLRFDEIVLETLRNLPPTVTEFGKLTEYSAVTSIQKVARRKPAFNAYKVRK